MFKHLDGETAILKKSGVYKVVDLYERDGILYAAWAGGYVRLGERGTTSTDKLYVDTIALEHHELYRTRLGSLAIKPAEGRKKVEATKVEQLMISQE